MNTQLPILVVGSVDTLAAEIVRRAEPHQNYRPPAFWLWQGETLRAAQPTLEGARHHWQPGWHITSTPFPNGKAVEHPLHNYADQRAVLDCKPLRGLRAVHECGGLYVIVRECPHAPDNIEVIAENLTAEHARQICEAVNGRNRE